MINNKPPWDVWAGHVFHLLITKKNFTEDKAEDLVFGLWTDSVYDMWKEDHSTEEAVEIISNPRQSWNQEN